MMNPVHHREPNYHVFLPIVFMGAVSLTPYIFKGKLTWDQRVKLYLGGCAAWGTHAVYMYYADLKNASRDPGH